MFTQRTLGTSTLTLTSVLVCAGVALSGCVIGEVDQSQATISSAQQAAFAEQSKPQPTFRADQPGVGSDGQVTPSQSMKPKDGAAPGGLEVLAGKTIYLDPGHAAVMQSPMTQVTDGRGGMKPCQVTGTAANDGWTEHTFNWVMVQQIKQQLEAVGATVLLTRADDAGVADCIDVRAQKENASAADAVVSVHADGAGEGNRGFHVITVSDPLPGNQAAMSEKMATSIRDSLVAAGFSPSNYLGTNGIDYRADLTGLNLSTKPKVLIEFGNMRDSVDYALLSDSSSQSLLAQSVVSGLADALR